MCRARVCPYGNSTFMCWRAGKKEKEKKERGRRGGVCAGGERGGGGCKTNDIVVAESVNVNRDQNKWERLTCCPQSAHRGRRLSIRLSSAGVFCIPDYAPTATKQFT